MLRLIAALTAVAALAVGILTAAPSNADSADLQFARFLDNADFNVWNFPGLRRQAIGSCQRLNGDWPMDANVDYLVSGPGYSVVDAATIIAAGIVAYCPWNMP